MRKLTKLHVLLIVLLVGVLATTIYFMNSYQQVEAKQPDIQDEIVKALARLEDAKKVEPPIDLTPYQKQLEELQTTIDQMKLAQEEHPLFPVRPPTVEIGNLIVDSVQNLYLTLVKLSPNDKAGTVTIKSDADPKSKGNKYNKAEYEVKVKGDVGRVISLIGKIEGANFATLTIEDIKMGYHEKTVEEITEQWWEAEFTLVTLYQYTTG